MEQVPERNDLVEAECRWIAALLDLGCRLTNQTTGGEGMINPSEETRIKLRSRPQVGWSPAAREAAHRALKARWQDPEFRAARISKMRKLPPRVVLRGDALREFKTANAIRMGKLNAGKVRSTDNRNRIASTLIAKSGNPQRHEQALALREQGQTYDQIATALGYAHGAGAYWAITQARKRIKERP